MRRYKEPGIYVDLVSGEPLFASSDKLESIGDGPSFSKPIGCPAGLRRTTKHADLRFVHRDDMAVEGYGDYLDQVEDIH